MDAARPGRAAEALRDTFVIAAATLGDLPGPPSCARGCTRWPAPNASVCRTTVRVRGGQVDPDPTAGASGDSAQAELRTMAGAILARLKPREREVIELSLRHDLYGTDLAEALGVSSRRAHALTVRARGRLEKALGRFRRTVPGARSARNWGSCWPTGMGSDRADARPGRGHVERRKAAPTHGLGGLRPAALFGLLPLALLPPVNCGSRS